ncbi:MAG: cupin domain-containing protein [Eubacterium sp.]
MAFVRNIGEPAAVEGFKGGKGHVLVRKILKTDEEMYNKGRVFNHMVLEKGCEVGKHTHEGDAETYYVLSGHGKYLNNDGKVVDVAPGDVMFTGDGETHALWNEEDEPLEFIALVLYK